MRFTLRHHRRQGITLLELIMSMSLLMLLTGLLLQIYMAGVRYYRRTVAIAALQQGCLMSASELSREIQQTTLGSIQEDTSAAKEYVTFASPRDQNGVINFSAGNLVLWQSFVCFYIDMREDRKCLMRQTSLIQPPTALTPTVPPTLTASYFRTLGIPTPATPSKARLVAENISNIEVQRGREIEIKIVAAEPNLQLRISVKTKILPRN